MECKKLMAKHLNAFLDPIRERRRYYEERPGRVEEIIAAGLRQGPRRPPAGPWRTSGRPSSCERTEGTVTDTARSRGRAATASGSRTSSRARWTCWST
ncbi:MAG: hypothetical protein MZV70_07295 [Desulfobacterales bacterium]|nr:hypothetical protein [Desulfobacterales bacterium]